MNQRSLPVLLLLLIVLGALAWWVTREDPKERAAEELALLAGLGGAPTELHLINQDGSKEYRLKEGSLGWELVHPVEDEANEARVRLLLGQLDQAKKILARPDGDVTPEFVREAGLDQPRGVLVAKRGGAEVKIEFGVECFPPGKWFARVDGKVYKIPQGIQESVEQNLDDLRNPLLFRSSGGGVQELSILRRENGIEAGVFLQRQKDATFRVSERKGGESFPADPMQVNRILANLLGARARRFLRLGGDGAGEEWVKIELIGNFGRERVALSDPSQGVVYATKFGRPIRLEVDGGSFMRFVQQPVSDLISRQMWTFGPSSAASIRVEVFDRPKRPALVLERRPDGGMRIAQPVQRFAHDPAVNELIQAIETTVLDGVLRGDAKKAAQRALETPYLRIRLESPPDRRLEDFVVALARGPNGELYGRRGETETVWLVRSPGFPQLLRPWWEFVERVAFRYGGARPVVSIEVEREGRTQVFARGENGAWQVDGKELPADGFDFDRVFDTLKQVTASELLGADPEKILQGKKRLAVFRPLGSHPGDRQRVSLGVFEVYEGDGTRLLGRQKDDPLVYELSPRPSETLRAFLD